MLSEKWNNSTLTRRLIAFLVIIFHALAFIFIGFFLVLLSSFLAKPYLFYLSFTSIFIFFESYMIGKKSISNSVFVLFWRQLQYSVSQALSGSILALLIHATEESIPIAEISVKIILRLTLILSISLFLYFIITGFIK